ncbi:MAG TPA: helix-turn-helix transcriptional regulator [Clostridia bacterium]|nr:helix-turn-helix transcriptional regulator [Clostridia bacterium]
MGDDLLTVQETSELLKLNRNTVYEMLKRGEIPHCKIGKQIRVRRGDIEGKFVSARTQAPPAGEAAQAGAKPLVLCGQDPSLDLIAAHIGALPGMPQIFRSQQGSYNALVDLYAGRANIATAHLWDEKTGSYNLPYIEKLLPGTSAVVIRLFGRMAGFLTQKGNPKDIARWEDIARPDVRMVNRERGSGIRVLIDEKLRSHHILPSRVPGYDTERANHAAVAIAVSSGAADVGVGILAAARQVQDVDFIPIQKEWYDMVILSAQRDETPYRAVIDYVCSEAFAYTLSKLGEYDFAQTGRVFRL